MNTAFLTERFYRTAQVVVSIFAVFLAIVYGTGFLCVYTFWQRLGIGIGGGDVFKGKFVLVGILFLLFPVTVMCPLLIAQSIKNAQNKMHLPETDTARFPKASYALLANLCLLLYVYAVLLPPSFYLQPITEIVAPIIILVSTVGPILIHKIGRYYCGTSQSGCVLSCMRAVQWGLVAFVAILDFTLFYDYTSDLWEIVWGDGRSALYYVGFLVLIPLMVSVVGRRRRYVRRHGSYLFSQNDIVDPRKLFGRLKNSHDKKQRDKKPEDKTAEFLYRALTRQNKRLTDTFEVKGHDEYFDRMFCEGLNILISTRLLYKPRWFQIDLPQKVRNIVELPVHINHIERANRLLLERAYPRDIISCKSKPNVARRILTELSVNTICLCSMFYFLAIVAFGLRVYPYIPVAKGGGSFVYAPRVTLSLLEGTTHLSTNEQQRISTNVFIVIEQTATSLFLAQTNDAGGPVEWQKMGVKLPDIVELDRSCVGEIRSHQVITTSTE